MTVVDFAVSLPALFAGLDARHRRIPEHQQGRLPQAILVVLLFSGVSLAFA
jgi:hypothetical protein